MSGNFNLIYVLEIRGIVKLVPILCGNVHDSLKEVLITLCVGGNFMFFGGEGTREEIVLTLTHLGFWSKKRQSSVIFGR